jgi:hypothetical protein
LFNPDNDGVTFQPAQRFAKKQPQPLLIRQRLGLYLEPAELAAAVEFAAASPADPVI